MRQLIEPPNIASSGVRAFFTTKISADNNINAALAEELNIAAENIYLPVQKHTINIHVLDSAREPVIADAVVTNKKGILIGVLVADCVPVLLWDKRRGVIGAVHAGWRGTAGQILKETITTVEERYNCSTNDIAVAIGPSIRQCSYEVNEDVKSAVRDATGEGDYFRKKGEKYFIDLSHANKLQALSKGILQENIWQSDECTFCNPERFYSYRYAGGSAGRQGGFIGMW
ncbi:MAG: peptidoglycan editing factor PgeF [Nitrospiraceae bacterium]|nr:MAG: peptidoglycan editing factor PgeF [Nitrospiraceae bacterium]